MTINIRNELRQEETLELSIQNRAEELFFGDCFGIALIPREENDRHICLQILLEDDEYWFAQENTFSSFWLSELQEVLKAVQEWLKKNADPDPSNFGWKFRD